MWIVTHNILNKAGVCDIDVCKVVIAKDSANNRLFMLCMQISGQLDGHTVPNLTQIYACEAIKHS